MRSGACLAGAILAAACSAGAAPTSQPSPKSPGPSSSAGRAAAPAVPRGGAVLYRPTPPSLYALERRDSLTLELPGGGTQLQEFTRTAYLTIGVAEASGGSYRATIRLDSLRQAPGGTGNIIAPDSMLRAEGTTWSGSLTTAGRLGDLKADRASSVADQVGASLAVLFPVLPAAGLSDGAAWSDTAERTIKTDAFDTRERATTSYKVVKVEDRVYTIDAATGFQRTGTAGQAAQPMEMSSQGTRNSVYRFGADGAVLGAEGADSAEMTITVQAVGQTVPVHQRAKWKISRK